MTFAVLRQNVLQKGTLSFFGELVDFTRRGGTTSTPKVKISHRQSGPQSDSRRQAGPQRNNTVDELEQIEVTVSRDATFVDGAGTCLAMVDKPDPGDTLCRAPARDSDRRPFMFSGEIVFEGDQHAVYVFQRPRRFAAGGSR